MPFLFQSFKAKGGRTVQAEGEKYDPVRSISLKRGYNEIKENKCSYCAILGGTDIWITKRKLLR